MAPLKDKIALVIDDEPDIRELLEITLNRMGINTHSAENVSMAKSYLAENEYHLCFTDMNLPDGNGIDLVEHIQKNYPSTPVAMITAYGSVETAISALKAGAFDFVSKPIDLSQLRDMVTTALKLSEPGANKSSNTAPDSETKILGSSNSILKLNKKIAKLARSQAPIYISGESGSGKELVATMIHQQGPRSNSPFIPVNCGAIPPELMESEFFGHKKGSFSGAIDDKPGLFQAANGGTLFLDEIADLSLAMQVKLLRAIQEKAIRPVGSQEESKIDVRILSATHKDLSALVDAGDFRQDLFYRINVIKLDVPSLRERIEDIPELAQYFLNNIAFDCGVDDASFSHDAINALENYSFPGNVRELENIIERAFTLCEDDIITADDLQLNDNATSTSNPIEKEQPVTATVSETENQGTAEAIHRTPETSLEDYLEDIERKEIEEALAATKWNRTAAAKKLGISFRALRYRLKKLGLD